MKSVDDYRTIHKQLKKQIKKLQKEKYFLEKLKSHQLDFHTDDAEVVERLRQHAQLIGLTPEMIFRAADVNSYQVISKEQFSKFVQLSLRFDQNQTIQLWNLIDINKIGSISKEEFYDTLEIYRINSEQGKNLLQFSFLKYVQLIRQQRFDALVGYFKLDYNDSGYIQKDVFITFCKSLKNYKNFINDREIIGAFNYMDTDYSGYVSREEYLSKIKIEFDIQDRLKKAPQKEVFNPRQLELRRIFLNKNKTFKEFLIDLIKNIKNYNVGILYPLFREVALNCQIQGLEIVKFFQLIDSDQKGSISYDELMEFYLDTMDKNDRYEVLFIILAAKLKAMNISIQQYLMSEQLYEGQEIDQEQFRDVAINLFNCKKEEKIIILFQVLDIDNSQSINTDEVIKLIDMSLKQANIVLDHQERYQNVKKDGELTYQIIKPDEYFTIQPENEQSKIQYSTILNSSAACLKKIQLILEDLKIGQLWDDPEFGPRYDDPDGSKSMFYKDFNQLPQPQSVEWKRPKQIYANPIFYDTKVQRHPIEHSDFLNDCWFLSALTIVSQRKGFLQDDQNIQFGVNPQFLNTYNKDGIYVFRFFINGSWKYVIIDDKICTLDNKIVYSKSGVQDEFWVQLLEKAYAKIHICYQSLNGGDIQEALLDLTGYPVFKLDDFWNQKELLSIRKRYGITSDFETEQDDITQKNPRRDKDQKTNMSNFRQYKSIEYAMFNDKFQSLSQLTQETLFFSCYQDGRGQCGPWAGLYKGHTYNLIDLIKIPSQDVDQKYYHFILRVQSNWTFGEWDYLWIDQKIQHYEIQQQKQEKQEQQEKQIQQQPIQSQKQDIIVDKKSVVSKQTSKSNQGEKSALPNINSKQISSGEGSLKKNQVEKRVSVQDKKSSQQESPVKQQQDEFDMKKTMFQRRQQNKTQFKFDEGSNVYRSTRGNMVKININESKNKPITPLGSQQGKQDTFSKVDEINSPSLRSVAQSSQSSARKLIPKAPDVQFIGDFKELSNVKAKNQKSHYSKQTVQNFKTEEIEMIKRIKQEIQKKNMIEKNKKLQLQNDLLKQYYQDKGKNFEIQLEGEYFIDYYNFSQMFDTFFFVPNLQQEDWKGIRIRDVLYRNVIENTINIEGKIVIPSDTQYLLQIQNLQERHYIRITLNQYDVRLLPNMQYPFNNFANKLALVVCKEQGLTKPLIHRIGVINKNNIHSQTSFSNQRDIVSFPIDVDNGVYSLMILCQDQLNFKGQFTLQIYFQFPQQNITIYKDGRELNYEQTQEIYEQVPKS